MKVINGNSDLQELRTLTHKISAGLTMIQVCVKIGMTQDIAFSVTAASIYMTGLAIKQVGSYKKILRDQNDKDGKELITQI